MKEKSCIWSLDKYANNAKTKSLLSVRRENETNKNGKKIQIKKQTEKNQNQTKKCDKKAWSLTTSP